MRTIDQLCRFLLRFRYPVCLPEEVAHALGVNASNFMTFPQFIRQLSCANFRPSRLYKFMPREKAEEAFRNAHCTEQFRNSTLFSFYFPEGWMEFVLEFDDISRLRRVYMHHKHIKEERGIELFLNSCDESGEIHDWVSL